MEVLQPDWNQDKPTPSAVSEMLTALEIRPIVLSDPIFETFLARLRSSHCNGGVHLFCFEVGASKVFDGYTAGNRWDCDGFVDTLLTHPVILNSLQIIEAPQTFITGLTQKNGFLLDEYFANLLYRGGAYSPTPSGDGREEKRMALSVCNAIFGLRYGEVFYAVSYEPWTPWFYDVAWDGTVLLFDKRLRRLWLFVITDTD